LKKKKGTYKYVILATIMALSISLTACKSGDAVAKVNDEVITKDELYQALVEQNGAQVLDNMITMKVIDQEAKKQKVTVTEEDINKDLDALKSSYGGEAEFNSALQYFGYDIEDLKKDISLNLKIKKLIEPSITITEDEILEYFEENKDSLGEEEQVRARHILVETEDEAKKVKGKLDAGEDFADLAKEYSLDDSKDSGGELGFFSKGNMVKEFEDAAFSLDTNEISEPVKSEFGYHIIQLEERKDAKEATLDEVKDQIKDAILNNKINEAYPAWYQEVLKENKVENYLNTNN